MIHPFAHRQRLSQHGGWMLLLLVSFGCQTDLNARSSPLTAGKDQTGQAVVFGHYQGLYRHGATGQDHRLDLFADDCGAVMWGTLTLSGGASIDLVGERAGSTLDFRFESEEFSGQLIGQVETVRVLSGVWSSQDGQGGEWVAAYVEGSVEDYPCSVADDYLDALK